MLVQQTRNIGLRSIINSSGYKKVDSTTISFGVAPRINACGRMGMAEEALNLFLSKNINEVNELTKRLNEHNSLRQSIEKQIFEEVLKQIEENDLDKHKVIVLGGKNWHHGVIGIVSSKVTEMYFKPSILLSFEEDGIGKGSGRSIPGFDLHEALMKCSDTIEKFGGHSMAVGITVKKDNLEKFKKEFEQIATQSKIDEIIPIINIDAKVDLSDIDKEMVESLKQLEPFGEANKMPVFAFKNLKIDSIRALSEGKHLKLTLKDNNYIINAIGFNIGYLANEYRIGDKIDVAGVLEINTFNGVDNLQINIKDIMKSI
jgi:single-stranded-DNA-specific exonuclease